MINHPVLRLPAILPLLALCTLGVSCKTTGGGSGTKDLPSPAAISQMTLEQWVPICQAELANPTTGAASKAYLLQATNTSDCTAAYPIMQSIVQSATATTGGL